MISINKTDISGTVVSEVENECGSMTLFIEQTVANKESLKSRFPVLIPKSCIAKIKELNLKIGDRILITNALLYQKKGEWKLKICKDEDIQILEASPFKCDLGNENIDDFI